MARTFDGTDDNLLSANNALAGMNNASKSWSWWETGPTVASVRVVTTGMTTNGAGNRVWVLSHAPPTTAGYQLRLVAIWTTNGVWDSTDLTADTVRHIAVTYSRSSTANDPVMYVDGVAVTVTEVTAPLTTAATGDDTLKLGESDSGADDLTGSVQHLAIQAGALWSAAEVNRARWWGRPHGGLLAYYPLVTTTLTDEGSAGATLTATGTTVSAMVTPVVRPGSAMMGMDVGW